MARPERFELPTNWFEASYSIQLSYGRVKIVLYRVYTSRGRTVNWPGNNAATQFGIFPAWVIT